MSNKMSGREVIIEFQQVGNIVKVIAMDTASLIEISIQGPVSASESLLKTNALKRLEYVLIKKGIF